MKPKTKYIALGLAGLIGTGLGFKGWMYSDKLMKENYKSNPEIERVIHIDIEMQMSYWPLRHIEDSSLEYFCSKTQDICKRMKELKAEQEILITKTDYDTKRGVFDRIDNKANWYFGIGYISTLLSPFLLGFSIYNFFSKKKC
ncbi:hypothetical protein HYT23_02120 [Candidatus Pacearchaeota archaeon]|nr:hypothetical protein [Candidatus Pacearchaeota archaeon]